MPSFDLLLPFFLAAAAFACTPGPGMLYAAARTAAGGRGAGWRAALGFHLAGYLHIAAAAFGLALVLQTLPLLYTAVKLAGAAYLVWLGIRLLLARDAPAPPPHHAVRGHAVRGHAVRDGFVVEVLNPKTALFYLAFLPQFTEAAAALPVWAQVLILGAAVNLMFSATDALCILLSAGLTERLAASQATGRCLRRASGGVLVALGIHLATQRQ